MVTLPNAHRQRQPAARARAPCCASRPRNIDARQQPATSVCITSEGQLPIIRTVTKINRQRDIAPTGAVRVIDVETAGPDAVNVSYKLPSDQILQKTRRPDIVRAIDVRSVHQDHRQNEGSPLFSPMRIDQVGPEVQGFIDRSRESPA